MPGDRVAIVTGGAQGLGLGIARALTRSGYQVAVLDRDACTSAPSDAADLALMVDVANRAEVSAAVATVAHTFGRIDLVVNNAQTTRIGPILTATADDVDAVWRSGFTGTLHLMQAAHDHLVVTHGSIVNVASGAGLSAPAGYGVYAATKEAIRTITRVAAVEWGPEGIRVNALCPSARTPAFDAWEAAHPEEAAQRVAQVPLRRLGDAEHDIGAAVVFLASDTATYITGSTLVIDGGAHYLR